MIRTCLLFTPVLALLLSGCAGGIGVDAIRPETTYGRQMNSVLTGDGPSEWTKRTSRFLGYELEGEFRTGVDEALVGLKADARHGQTMAFIAAAELSLEIALGFGPGTGERRAQLLLTAALAHDGLLRLVGDADLPLGQGVPLGLGIYNRAVGELAQRLHYDLTFGADPADPLAPIDVAGSFGNYRVALERGTAELMWGPEYFDRIDYADALRIRGLRHRHRRGGLGAPMVGYRANSPERAIAEPFKPNEGIMYPVTARLRFGEPPRDPGTPRDVTLVLSDPVEIESVQIGNRRVSLCADFSAPQAMLDGKTDLGRSGQLGLLNADDYNYEPGLYLLDPFDPDRIPVILVHGLLSSPLTWRDVVNDIRGDPLLRDRYQVWMFVYPTGLPIPTSAATFRQALQDVEDAYDPYGLGEGLKHKVLVGHSMGGVISRLVVSDVGEDLWNAVFTLQPDELEISDTSRAWLENIMYWEPVEGIGRAVFVASPHRGSDMSLDFVGRLGSFLVDKPDELEAIGKELLDAHGKGVYQGRYGNRWGGGVPTSIDTLSPDDPIVKVLEQRGPTLTVPYHSIIGNNGKPDARNPSDGVVDVSSARLEGAMSELVVPAPHNAHEHPLAVREIRRILRLHIDDTDWDRYNRSRR
ncbi:MAG: alpha/beta fold hydrolase [Planctomycetota bacterium]